MDTEHGHRAVRQANAQAPSHAARQASIGGTGEAVARLPGREVRSDPPDRGSKVERRSPDDD